jgi:hypothetical protein
MAMDDLGGNLLLVPDTFSGPAGRMRETRLSGLEGGGTETNRSSLPLSPISPFLTVAPRRSVAGAGEDFEFDAVGAADFGAEKASTPFDIARMAQITTVVL